MITEKHPRWFNDTFTEKGYGAVGGVVDGQPTGLTLQVHEAHYTLFEKYTQKGFSGEFMLVVSKKCFSKITLPPSRVGSTKRLRLFTRHGLGQLMKRVTRWMLGIY